eukprot:1548402-Rhodomonas_salina.1
MACVCARSVQTGMVHAECVRCSGDGVFGVGMVHLKCVVRYSDEHGARGVCCGVLCRGWGWGMSCVLCGALTRREHVLCSDEEGVRAASSNSNRWNKVGPPPPPSHAAYIALSLDRAISLGRTPRPNLTPRIFVCLALSLTSLLSVSLSLTSLSSHRVSIISRPWLTAVFSLLGLTEVLSLLGFADLGSFSLGGL